MPHETPTPPPPTAVVILFDFSGEGGEVWTESSQALAAEIEEDDVGAPPTQPPGRVKRSWLSRRRMGAATIAGVYCDVGHSESVRHLRDALAPRVIHYGLDDLDAGDLGRRAPRRLTQEISRYVFTLADATGRAAFQGIRYASRLGVAIANWAIFEPNEPTALSSADIDEDDADLQAVLTDYNITFVD